MRNRQLVLGGAGALAGLAVVLGLGFGGSLWSSPAEPPAVAPLPPVPPRIATGADYERCLAMLNADPLGARTFAEAWLATGGGEGAAHCSALALVALGEPDTGAAALDRLASRSHAAPAARAAVYGQAGQAWMMAGAPDRALGATTMALSMTPDDADLLIDRSIASATLESYQPAVDDLTHALDLDPRRTDALVFRAAAWRHLNHLDLEHHLVALADDERIDELAADHLGGAERDG